MNDCYQRTVLNVTGKRGKGKQRKKRKNRKQRKQKRERKKEQKRKERKTKKTKKKKGKKEEKTNAVSPSERTKRPASSQIYTGTVAGYNLAEISELLDGEPSATMFTVKPGIPLTRLPSSFTKYLSACLQTLSFLH